MEMKRMHEPVRENDRMLASTKFATNVVARDIFGPRLQN